MDETCDTHDELQFAYNLEDYGPNGEISDSQALVRVLASISASVNSLVLEVKVARLELANIARGVDR